MAQDKNAVRKVLDKVKADGRTALPRRAYAIAARSGMSSPSSIPRGTSTVS